APRAHRRAKRRVRLPLLGLAAAEVRDGHVDVEDRSGDAVRRVAIGSVRLRSSPLRLGGDARLRIDAATSPDAVAPDAHIDLQIARLGLQDEAQTPFVARVELQNTDLATWAIVAGRSEPWAGRVGTVVAEATGGLDHCFVDVAVRTDGALRLGPHLPVPH